MKASAIHRFPERASLFLVVSAKSRLLLYVGDSLRHSLGYDAESFLGKKWDLLSRIVVEEYREGFAIAIREYLGGRSTLPHLFKARAASGRIVDCEIGSCELLSGTASERVVTCRFAAGEEPVGVKSPAVRGGEGARPGAGDAPPHSETPRDIARELHETVAQDLFLCKGKLIALRGASGKHVRARFLAEALGYLDQSTESFRDVLSALASPAETPRDLRCALMGAMRWARQKYGMDVSLRVTPGLSALGAPAHDLVLSSARELLTNVFKHSGQRSARVALRRAGTGVRLDVVDFGSGISRPAAAVTRGGKSGLGLSGIRERAGKLGGSVEIESMAATRTRVSVILPYGGHG
jgi:hypothetical protein